MKTCPICKGKKTVTASYEEFGKPETKDTFEVKCYTCNGKGKVTPKELAEYEFEQNMWCKHEDVQPEEIEFYDDGEHPELDKHHYRHAGCGKVVQIG